MKTYFAEMYDPAYQMWFPHYDRSTMAEAQADAAEMSRNFPQHTIRISSK